MNRVIVVGSVNQDVTVKVERHPLPGETLTGNGLSYRLGGKGANQAAAAAHAGVETVFVGAVGADSTGDSLRDELAMHDVNMEHLATIDTASGSAFITVAANGENTIVLDPGANGQVASGALDAITDLDSSDVVVLQGELPLEVNIRSIKIAAKVNARVVWNPAPAISLSDIDLTAVTVLVVNETEAGIALDVKVPEGIEAALEAAEHLRALGPTAVLITLGEKGGVWADGTSNGHFPATKPSRVVDTTGAGDATVGVLSAALAKGYSFPDAVAEGLKAGSAAVENEGAAASYSVITPLA
ncbi:ribokinase [Dermabacter vaginalis]|uniref:Ribokinase n=1 Tax=Dermabacter vaginalis TaxID=1630135 RepID=A0A1B0ZK30_9MICO|nr:MULTISPECIES: ribokinase [Dermabacter]SHW96186.1 ribokinase [Mycobacteroides abscessus subsp. abscessus]ANP28375.1 hypothetical protein DAD186_18250 [Dermabacter vaginalis]MCG7443571.1 ribokinase [Dermabacter vaginalis]MCT2150338.1 ribokinase [Dermabacter vaginalis]QEU11254.1 ribokinase [Dermabacter vaginalis]